MAATAVNMDAFDHSLDNFTYSEDVSASNVALGAATSFPATQLKDTQSLVSPQAAYNSSLFFPDLYEFTDYNGDLTRPTGPGPKQTDEPFPDMTMSDLDADMLHGGDFRDTAGYGPAENMGPQRRHTDSTLSTAQTRRKAQNRAAQRAFRERKERHVRELESRLSVLTEKTTSLQCDNDRLVNLLKKVQSENQMMQRPSKKLRAASFSDLSIPASLSGSPTPVQPTFDAKASSGSSSAQSLTEPSTPGSATSGMSLSMAKCLDPAAAWDLLVSHPLFADGALDVAQVCSRLSSLARCEDTMGPVFDEVDVRKVIEEVAHLTGARIA